MLVAVPSRMNWQVGLTLALACLAVAIALQVVPPPWRALFR